MKKLWIAVAAIAVVTIEVCMLIMGLTKDKTSPIITVYQDRIAYSFGCSDETILAGIEAKDNRDGDVSKDIIVVSRSVIQPDKLERVEVTASDKSGNVATTKLIFAIEDDNTYMIYDASKYSVDMENLQFKVDGSSVAGELSGYEVITKPQRGDKTTEDTTPEATTEEPTTEAPTPEATTPEATTEAPTPESTTPEVTTVPEETTTPTVGEDGRPIIVLKSPEITLAAGSSEMSLVGCIQEIYDDKDSRDALFRRVGFTRRVNLSQPGDYTVGLYCTDSDGNRSEVVELIVHVQ